MEKNISDTFRNGTVLVTGGTGFLGKILTEKLLRSCSVKNIAILVRTKKGVSTDQRIENIYKKDIFDRIRKENPDFMSCIKIIDGNIEDPSLGLSKSDRDWMIENVNFVFHCAARIKFNDALELSTKINVQGTENLLVLATEIKNLQGFVHVSTAYSHCPRDEIKEQFYPVPITAMELKDVLKNHDASTPNILGNWPNTYTFTKAITENMISTNEYKLPISIFRPSIIVCTKSEPVPGWLENMNGPSGILTGVIVGFLRAIPIDSKKITDMIPVDYTANALISVMWDTVNRYKDLSQINKEPKIYNYVSSIESPVTWGEIIKTVHINYNDAPPLRSMWYGFCVFYTNLLVGRMLRFWLHWMPAAIVDTLLVVSGNQSKMLKMYARTEDMMDLLYTFSTRQWTFDNSNIIQLWSSLSDEDRQTFWYSLEEFDWKIYIKIFYFGIKKYILHEDLSNTTIALAKNRKLYWLHQLCKVLIIIIIIIIIILIIYLTLQILWLSIKYACKLSS